MRIKAIHASIDTYREAFREFTRTYDLPMDLFAEPDHATVQCAGAEDYDETLEAIIGVGGLVAQESRVSDRRIAAVHLATQSVLAGASLFEWLEVVQPRPGSERPQGFVENVAYVHDLHTARNLLDEQDIPGVEERIYPVRSSLIVPLGNDLTVKFNDTSLAEVAARAPDGN